MTALLPHQTGQQLWDPWQPVVGGNVGVVLVHHLERGREEATLEVRMTIPGKLAALGEVV